MISFWGNLFLPTAFYNDLPLPIVGGVVAAALYALSLLVSRPPVPVPDVAPGQSVPGMVSQEP